MNTNDNVIEIIKNKISTEYNDDISLLIEYDAKPLNSEKNIGSSFYFVPKTEKAKRLSTQFIIEDISYDLFPMDWSRLVAIAAMDSPQAYLILDSKILYSSCDEELQRFMDFKTELTSIMNGGYEEALLNKSFEYFNETYIYLFNMQNIAKSLIDMKIEISKILSTIANSLAFSNSTYYKGGNGSYVSIIEESFNLEKLPINYETLVRKLIFSDNMDELLSSVNELLNNTRTFLHHEKEILAQTEPFEIFFIGYYEELKRVLNRFLIAADNKDYIKLFSLSSYIHEELSQFMTKVERGLWFDDRNVYSEYSQTFDKYFKVDLLQLICDKNQNEIISSIKKFETDFVSLLNNEGINLLNFNSTQDFNNYFQSK